MRLIQAMNTGDRDAFDRYASSDKAKPDIIEIRKKALDRREALFAKLAENLAEMDGIISGEIRASYRRGKEQGAKKKKVPSYMRKPASPVGNAVAGALSHLTKGLPKDQAKKIMLDFKNKYDAIRESSEG